ncbi:hypothetical protein [Cyanobium sp. ATX-6F1]|uniref:hypothetical protein n=1 Tax=Cyanobium sp. ATX-6F1 TaxID=3137388 RepID=UPI0039BDFD32
MIDTFGGTVADQLLALDLAKQRLATVEQRLGGRPRTGNLKPLKGLVDADLTIAGPSIQRLNLDLAAKGHLWLDGADQDVALGLEPFVARLEGPLAEGPGRFSLEHLPLSLLVLATPVPGELRGGLSLKGRYRLGGGAPSLELALALENARYRDEPLNLTRGELRLASGGLSGDLSFHVGEARNSIDLSGRVPLDPTAEGLQLRLASRGDGLTFLTALGGMVWCGAKAAAICSCSCGAACSNPWPMAFCASRTVSSSWLTRRCATCRPRCCLISRRWTLSSFRRGWGTKAASRPPADSACSSLKSSRNR